MFGLAGGGPGGLNPGWEGDPTSTWLEVYPKALHTREGGGQQE